MLEIKINFVFGKKLLISKWCDAVLLRTYNHKIVKINENNLIYCICCYIDLGHSVV